jgi:hypothetical protein
MTEAISQRLAGYNNQRHFKYTTKVYDSIKMATDAHIHYQAALAFMMLGQSADEPVKRLKQCPNYTEIMEGDLYRDTALQLIRQGGDLERAQRLLNQAFERHGRDKQRYAIDLQAQSRLQEARGETGPAYRTIQEAVDILWNNANTINPTWLANTAFHATRISVKMKQRRYAQLMAHFVAQHDASWRKRWAARLMAYLPGEVGVRIVNKLR